MSTKQPITDKQLDWFAAQLESYAAKYREMAKLMRDNHLAPVEMTGWKTIDEKVLFHLSGHAARGRATVDKAIDAKTASGFFQESDRDKKTNAVVADIHAQAEKLVSERDTRRKKKL